MKWEEDHAYFEVVARPRQPDDPGHSPPSDAVSHGHFFRYANEAVAFASKINAIVPAVEVRALRAVRRDPDQPFHPSMNITLAYQGDPVLL